MKAFATVVAALLVTLQAAEYKESAKTVANPIRKVVTMLQAMQAKITEEGEKEEELYKKFMCFCQNSGTDLQKSIEAAETKIPALGSDIKKAEEQKAQVDAAVSQAQDDRAAAKDAMKEATAVRKKEAETFAAFKAESDANIDAMTRAIAALEKGMGESFLQSNNADSAIIRKLAQKLDGSERDDVMAFIEGKYAPQSGQITGILKQMLDEMTAALKEATEKEESALKAYDALMAAKKKEVTVLTEQIEANMERGSELGVKIVQMKNDLTDTEESLAADKQFLEDLEKGCSTKTAEWEERTKTRADELVALGDTIKILNDDDALELFKKTLPSPTSFMQVKESSRSLRVRAAAQLGAFSRADQYKKDLILLAIKGKKIGFDKVIGMIDAMIQTLKTEQKDDDKKKEYCNKELDLSDDKKKGLERALSDSNTAIEKAEEDIATLKEEVAALTAGIKELDDKVAEATEQRKKEHEEYNDLMRSDTAAKELLGFAKNRLNKFYNPKLYKPPAKRELARDDEIVVNMGGTAPPTPAPGGIAGTGISSLVEISAHHQSNVAPPPPPETFGAYTKKSDESGGVIAMINLLITDLDKEMSEAEAEEKDAQGDYEDLMKRSAEKRTADSKSLTEKEGAISDIGIELEDHKENKASATKELAATNQYIASLHAECDWLLQYFDVRAEARASEIDALGKAKAVLSGSSFEG